MSEVSHVGENDRRLSPLDQMADDEWITSGDDQWISMGGNGWISMADDQWPTMVNMPGSV